MDYSASALAPAVSSLHSPCFLFFFFFNDTATTEIYTLSLHDALPIFGDHQLDGAPDEPLVLLPRDLADEGGEALDRKSTRLNSSHPSISYAVFCLKKKKKKQTYYHA